MDHRFRPGWCLIAQTRRSKARHAERPRRFPQVHDGYAVHLTERCDGWSITVVRAGRAAPFEVHHRDPQHALTMAKTVAVTEGADLLVLTAIGRGHEFVRAAHVASYALPIDGALADGSLRTSSTPTCLRDDLRT